MNDLIEKLSILRSQLNCFDENERDVYSTLSEAIKVLSERPESCEDAVSRQILLDDLKKLKTAWKKYPVMAEQIKGVETAIGYVKTIPSVAPKRKTGKWTLLEECANAGYYCSECRKRVVKEGWSGTVKKIKFCPNCGADMRQREENK